LCAQQKKGEFAFGLCGLCFKVIASLFDVGYWRFLLG